MASPQRSPNLDRLYSINVDGSRNFLHPADVRGRFITRRRLVFVVLMAIYLILPLAHVGGHPAVHLDIPDRRFYLFGAVYNSQDFWIVVFIVTGMAFGLLFMTAWLGRVWCGWACPQTVFLEGVYRPIERLLEGPRSERVRRDAGPWTLGKLARKAIKHLGFIVVSLVIGHVTLSLFVSWASLIQMVQHSPTLHWEAFLWTMAIAGGFYFNFAWFREQLCIVVCPYGRLQSALTDRDSLLVGYDRDRGEPRGKVGSATGACIECQRCVAVCPTGIDIRDGLQLECIGCTQCIDACDEMMDKVKRPRGLIRYDSQNGLEGKPRRTLRPRLVVYGGLVVAALSGLVISTAVRQPFEANLLRDRGAPYILEEGGVRNQYELHLINKNPVTTTFRLAVSTPVKGDYVVPQQEMTLQPLESARLPIFVRVQRADFHGPFDVTVEVKEASGPHHKTARARFLGPMVPVPAT